jgi:hypothetical protein
MSRRHLLRLAAAAVAAVASIVTLGAQYPPPSTVIRCTGPTISCSTSTSATASSTTAR